MPTVGDRSDRRPVSGVRAGDDDHHDHDDDGRPWIYGAVFGHLPVDLERVAKRLVAVDRWLRYHDDDHEHNDNDDHDAAASGSLRPAGTARDDDANARHDDNHDDHRAAELRLLLSHLVSLGGRGLHGHGLRDRRHDASIDVHDDDHDVEHDHDDTDPLRLQHHDDEHHNGRSWLRPWLRLGGAAIARRFVAVAVNFQWLFGRLPVRSTDWRSLLQYGAHGVR